MLAMETGNKKINKVKRITVNKKEMTTPKMQKCLLEASKNNKLNLITEPIRLLRMAYFARSKANSDACNGDWIYKNKKQGAKITIYLLALLVPYICVKIGMEKKVRTIVANAPDAKDIRID